MENQVQQKLPNSTATLVLGIISIVGSCCYGIVGLICGIIALIISKKANQLLKENPNGYSDSGNHKAGRICAIIGLVLSAIMVIYMILMILVWGVALADMNDMYNY